MRRTSAHTRRSAHVTLLFVVVAVVSVACGGTEFRVNPTLGPTPDASPNPTPSAQVFRTVPMDSTPSNGGSSGSRLPFALDQTPVPRTSFLVTPTSVITPGGFELPPGARLVTGSIRMDAPEGQLRAAFQGLEWQEAASIKSKFYRVTPLDPETGEGTSSEVLVQVEGQYRLEVIDDGDVDPWAFLQNNHRQFSLKYTQLETDEVDQFEGEIKAHRSRLVIDTVGTGLKTYRSLAEWRDDAEREIAGMAMFMTLALTGGAIVPDQHFNWITFEPGEVVESRQARADGLEVTVFEVKRTNEFGEAEDWRVQLDREGRPERVELTITSEDPARSVRGAELEITYSGEVLEPAGLFGE